MPNLSEIRQKYPQYNDMSDADFASAFHKKFYSDMPEAEFNAKLGLTQPAPVSPDQSYSSSILPMSKDAQGNVSFDSNAGLLGALKRSFMLPGDVMAGEVDPMSQAGIGRAAEFAGVFSPMSPAAGTGKTIAAIAQQNAPKPQGMEAAVAANRIGVDLPRAVASDSAIMQQGGKIISNVPLGGTPLRNASQKAINQLGEAATRVQKEYGTGTIADAGGGVRQGLTDYATKTLTGRVRDAYDNVDSLITQNVTTPLSETAKVATDISARRSNAALGDSSAVSVVRKALSNPDGLNYQGIKDLRTSVGEMLDKPNLIPSDMSEAELRRVYGGLTADLKSAVARSGGDKATSAFEAANQLAAKTAKEREGLQKVLGNDISDERLFDRISAMAGSNSRADRVGLLRVRSAVSNETWNDMASGVISRIGRDADGNFSPDRFITGYGKLSPEGKNVLFGGKKELASSLDDIAAVSRQFKQLNQYANPSGTGQTAIGASYLSGMFLEPTTVVGSVVGARVLSSIMAKPVSARALAKYSQAYQEQAFNPTSSSAKALENSARVLSALIANETGNKSISAQIFPSISGVRQVPANQGNENGNVPEAQDGGVAQKPRMLLPNEL